MWRYWNKVKYILFNDHVFRINFSSWTGLCYIRKSNRFGGVLKEESFKLVLPPAKCPEKMTAGKLSVIFGLPRRFFSAYVLSTEQ